MDTIVKMICDKIKSESKGCLTVTMIGFQLCREVSTFLTDPNSTIFPDQKDSIIFSVPSLFHENSTFILEIITMEASNYMEKYVEWKARVDIHILINLDILYFRRWELDCCGKDKGVFENFSPWMMTLRRMETGNVHRHLRMETVLEVKAKPQHNCENGSG